MIAQRCAAVLRRLLLSMCLDALELLRFSKPMKNQSGASDASKSAASPNFEATLLDDRAATFSLVAFENVFFKRTRQSMRMRDGRSSLGGFGITSSD